MWFKTRTLTFLLFILVLFASGVLSVERSRPNANQKAEDGPSTPAAASPRQRGRARFLKTPEFEQVASDYTATKNSNQGKSSRGGASITRHQYEVREFVDDIPDDQPRRSSRPRVITEDKFEVANAPRATRLFEHTPDSANEESKVSTDDLFKSFGSSVIAKDEEPIKTKLNLPQLPLQNEETKDELISSTSPKVDSSTEESAETTKKILEAAEDIPKQRAEESTKKSTDDSPTTRRTAKRVRAKAESSTASSAKSDSKPVTRTRGRTRPINTPVVAASTESSGSAATPTPTINRSNFRTGRRKTEGLKDRGPSVIEEVNKESQTAKSRTERDSDPNQPNFGRRGSIASRSSAHAVADSERHNGSSRAEAVRGRTRSRRPSTETQEQPVTHSATRSRSRTRVTQPEAPKPRTNITPRPKAPVATSSLRSISRSDTFTEFDTTKNSDRRSEAVTSAAKPERVSRGRSRSRFQIAEEPKLEVLPLFETEPKRVVSSNRARAPRTRTPRPLLEELIASSTVENPIRVTAPSTSTTRSINAIPTRIKETVLSEVSEVVSRKVTRRKKPEPTKKPKENPPAEDIEEENYPPQFKALIKATQTKEKEIVINSDKSEPISSTITLLEKSSTSTSVPTLSRTEIYSSTTPLSLPFPPSSLPSLISSTSMVNKLVEDVDNDLVVTRPPRRRFSLSTTTKKPKSSLVTRKLGQAAHPDMEKLSKFQARFSPSSTSSTTTTRKPFFSTNKPYKPSSRIPVTHQPSLKQNVKQNRYSSKYRNVESRQPSSTFRGFQGSNPVYVPTVPPFASSSTTNQAASTVTEDKDGMNIISINDERPFSNFLFSDNLVSETNSSMVATTSSTNDTDNSILERIISSITTISTSTSTTPSSNPSTAKANDAINPLSEKLETSTTSSSILQRILNSLSAIQTSDNNVGNLTGTTSTTIAPVKENNNQQSTVAISLDDYIASLGIKTTTKPPLKTTTGADILNTIDYDNGVGFRYTSTPIYTTSAGTWDSTTNNFLDNIRSTTWFPGTPLASTMSPNNPLVTIVTPSTNGILENIQTTPMSTTTLETIRGTITVPTTRKITTTERKVVASTGSTKPMTTTPTIEKKTTTEKPMEMSTMQVPPTTTMQQVSSKTMKNEPVNNEITATNKTGTNRMGKLLEGPSSVKDQTTNNVTSSNTSTTSTTIAPDDYFVFAVLNNNTIVRKKPRKIEAPYFIVGVYPNNTIVRKFPNGTIVPDEPVVQVSGFDTRDPLPYQVTPAADTDNVDNEAREFSNDKNPYNESSTKGIESSSEKSTEEDNSMTTRVPETSKSSTFEEITEEVTDQIVQTTQSSDDLNYSLFTTKYIEENISEDTTLVSTTTFTNVDETTEEVMDQTSSINLSTDFSSTEKIIIVTEEDSTILSMLPTTTNINEVLTEQNEQTTQMINNLDRSSESSLDEFLFSEKINQDFKSLNEDSKTTTAETTSINPTLNSLKVDNTEETLKVPLLSEETIKNLKTLFENSKRNEETSTENTNNLTPISTVSMITEENTTSINDERTEINIKVDINDITEAEFSTTSENSRSSRENNSKLDATTSSANNLEETTEKYQSTIFSVDLLHKEVHLQTTPSRIREQSSIILNDTDIKEESTSIISQLDESTNISSAESFQVDFFADEKLYASQNDFKADKNRNIFNEVTTEDYQTTEANLEMTTVYSDSEKSMSTADRPYFESTTRLVELLFKIPDVTSRNNMNSTEVSSNIDENPTTFTTIVSSTSVPQIATTNSEFRIFDFQNSKESTTKAASTDGVRIFNFAIDSPSNENINEKKTTEKSFDFTSSRPVTTSNSEFRIFNFESSKDTTTLKANQNYFYENKEKHTTTTEISDTFRILNFNVKSPTTENNYKTATTAQTTQATKPQPKATTINTDFRIFYFKDLSEPTTENIEKTTISLLPEEMTQINKVEISLPPILNLKNSVESQTMETVTYPTTEKIFIATKTAEVSTSEKVRPTTINSEFRIFYFKDLDSTTENVEKSTQNQKEDFDQKVETLTTETNETVDQEIDFRTVDTKTFVKKSTQELTTVTTSPVTSKETLELLFKFPDATTSTATPPLTTKDSISDTAEDFLEDFTEQIRTTTETQQANKSPLNIIEPLFTFPILNSDADKSHSNLDEAATGTQKTFRKIDSESIDQTTISNLDLPSFVTLPEPAETTEKESDRVTIPVITSITPIPTGKPQDGENEITTPVFQTPSSIATTSTTSTTPMTTTTTKKTTTKPQVQRYTTTTIPSWIMNTEQPKVMTTNLPTTMFATRKSVTTTTDLTTFINNYLSTSRPVYTATTPMTPKSTSPETTTAQTITITARRRTTPLTTTTMRTTSKKNVASTDNDIDTTTTYIRNSRGRSTAAKTTTTEASNNVRSKPTIDPSKVDIDQLIKSSNKKLTDEQLRDLESLKALEREQANLLKQLSVLTNLNFGQSTKPPVKSTTINPQLLANKILEFAMERERQTTSSPKIVDYSIPDTSTRKLPALDSKGTTVEDIIKELNAHQNTVESSTTKGKSQEALIAAILKERGIEPSTPKVLEDVYRQTTTRRPYRTTTRAPPRILQGLSWLLNAMGPPPQPQPRPRPRPKPATTTSLPFDDVYHQEPTELSSTIYESPTSKKNSRKPVNALSDEELGSLIKQLEEIQKDPKKAQGLDLTAIRKLQAQQHNRVVNNKNVEIITSDGSNNKREQNRIRTVKSTTTNSIEFDEDEPKPARASTQRAPRQQRVTLPPVELNPIPGIEDYDSGVGGGEGNAIGGNFLKAAVNVTRAISTFLGTALQGAAQTFQTMIGAGSSGVGGILRASG